MYAHATYPGLSLLVPGFNHYKGPAEERVQRLHLCNSCSVLECPIGMRKVKGSSPIGRTRIFFPFE